MNYSIRTNVAAYQRGESNVRGYASVVFGDSFKVSNITILENRETGQLYVSMPRFLSNEKDEQGNQVYKDVCNPINRDFREELTDNILKAFERAKTDDKAILTVNADDHDMPAFKVSVTPFERDGSTIRGLARIYIDDCFVINNVSVLEGNNGLFVSMPSYRTKKFDDRGKPVYQDVCFPITKAFRDRLYGVILNAYHEEKSRDDDVPDLSQAEEQYDKDMGKSEGGFAKVSEEDARRVDAMFR